MLWDTLQVAAGAALIISGAGAGIGVLLVVGGVNGAINHTSMALTGKGYNLLGNLSNGIGKVYNNTLGNVLGKSGAGGFVNGLLSGTGSVISSMGQFDVYDTGQAINVLATNAQARAQLGSSVGNWFHQLSSGNTYVAGETTAVVASLLVGGGDVAKAADMAKASDATSVLGKTSIFARTLTTEALENGKNLLTLPSRTFDNISGKLSDLRTAFSQGSGLGYAFANAEDSSSVLNKIDREAITSKGSSSTSRVTETANNMTDVFKRTDFGSTLEKNSVKTSKIVQGQSVYKVTKKMEIGNVTLRKGDQFYLDNAEKNHIEVFDKRGKAETVLNFDGTVNESKKNTALEQGRTIK